MKTKAIISSSNMLYLNYYHDVKAFLYFSKESTIPQFCDAYGYIKHSQNFNLDRLRSREFWIN